MTWIERRDPDRAGPWVKICCISSIAEADVAIAAGTDLLGLVSDMPSGPGVIPDDRIVEIAVHADERAHTVLLTCRNTAAGIASQLADAKPAVVQICDALPPGEHDRLRSLAPDVAIMQVIHVSGPRSVQEAVNVAPRVDAILLDSGTPGAPIRELGGTGRRHDWALSRAIRDAVACPLFLAGGLRAENVAEAIATVRPFGVDVCSGVRTDGRLDPSKASAFLAAVRSGVRQDGMS